MSNQRKSFHEAAESREEKLKKQKKMMANLMENKPDLFNADLGYHISPDHIPSFDHNGPLVCSFCKRRTDRLDKHYMLDKDCPGHTATEERKEIGTLVAKGHLNELSHVSINLNELSQPPDMASFNSLREIERHLKQASCPLFGSIKAPASTVSPAKIELDISDGPDYYEQTDGGSIQMQPSVGNTEDSIIDEDESSDDMDSADSSYQGSSTESEDANSDFVFDDPEPYTIVHVEEPPPINRYWRRKERVAPDSFAFADCKPCKFVKKYTEEELRLLSDIRYQMQPDEEQEQYEEAPELDSPAEPLSAAARRRRKELGCKSS